MLFKLVHSNNVSHEPAAYILGDFFYPDNGSQQVPPKHWIMWLPRRPYLNIHCSDNLKSDTCKPSNNIISHCTQIMKIKCVNTQKWTVISYIHNSIQFHGS